MWVLRVRLMTDSDSRFDAAVNVAVRLAFRRLRRVHSHHVFGGLSPALATVKPTRCDPTSSNIIKIMAD